MATKFRGWRKSSRSASQTVCVEVGTAPGLVGVRDTKDRDGGIVSTTRTQWATFIDAIKADNFSR